MTTLPLRHTQVNSFKDVLPEKELREFIQKLGVQPNADAAPAAPTPADMAWTWASTMGGYPSRGSGLPVMLAGYACRACDLTQRGTAGPGLPG